MSRADAELDWFAFVNDLNAAVFKTNAEYRMLFDTRRTRREEIKEAIAKGNAEHGSEATVALRDKLLEVSWPPKPEPIKPPPLPETERKPMSITGLQQGAFQGTIEALRQRLIDKQSQGAAKIAAAGEAGAAKIDEAVSNAEAKIDKEISEVLQDFSPFTNGGPV